MILLILLIAGVVGWLGVRLGRKLRILDKPGPDVPKRNPVPTLQGVMTFVGMIVLFALLKPEFLSFEYSNPFFGLLLGGGLLLLVSIIDEMGRLVDRRLRVHPLMRLFTQISAVIIAFYASGVGFTEFLLPGNVLIEFAPLIQLVLTIVRYLVFINAINFFDGIYGLASGMSSIGFLTIAILLGLVVVGTYPDITFVKAEMLQNVGIVAMMLCALSLVAAIIEYKPRGVLRDAGTTFLGFALAYLSLLGGAKIGTMIVVLALPLFDAIRVVADRIRRKQNPFKGDYTHLHYRLMALGWSRHEVRFFVWSLSVALMILMILQGSDRVGKVIIFLMLAVAFFGVNWYLFWHKKLPSEYQVDGKKD